MFNNNLHLTLGSLPNAFTYMVTFRLQGRYYYFCFTDVENNFPKVIQLVKWQNLILNLSLSDFTDFFNSSLPRGFI